MAETINCEKKQELVIAKHMSRVSSLPYKPFFDLNIIWCRVAYQKFESLMSVEARHSFYELHYVLHGRLDFICENTGYSLKDGDYLLIPPGKRHETVFSADDTEKFVFGFNLIGNNSYIDKAVASLADIEIRHETPRMRPLVELMVSCASEYHSGVTNQIHELSRCMLTELLNNVSALSPEDRDDVHRYESDIRIETAKQYIADNIALDISPEDVAAHIHMSSRQLNRILGVVSGCTVKDLIDSEKAEYIKSLVEKKYTLSKIAEMSGFSSEYSLNRFFMRVEGTTVRVWKTAKEK